MPACFLVAHAGAILLGGARAPQLSLTFLVIAPLLASAACLYRGTRTDRPLGWIALATAFLCWAGGMAATMAGTLWFHTDGQAAIAMLLFVLYGVPLIMVLASPQHDVWQVRAVDAALAGGLGILFFAYTFTFSTLSGASEAGMAGLRLMFDIENGYIALLALVRLRAAKEGMQRRLFASLGLYACAYLAAAAYINHVESQSNYGVLVDLVIDFPFVLLASLALWPVALQSTRASHRLAQVVDAGSPLILPASLLIVSALLVETRPWFAVGGFAAALLGYGLRNVLERVRGFDEMDKLEQLTRIDALTGLPNRRHFDEALRREWGRTRRSVEGLVILMIDIDHFKLINDTYGHAVGDARLRDVAEALSGFAVRSTDMVARYGGEEFAMILPALSIARARDLAERMRAAVRSMALPPPMTGEVVTVSVGVAGAHSGTPELLLRRADAALYEAKSAGRDRVEVAT